MSGHEVRGHAKTRETGCSRGFTLVNRMERMEGMPELDAWDK